MEPPECPVCLQSFDERDAIHRVLSCGHSVCQTCLAELPQPYPDTIRLSLQHSPSSSSGHSIKLNQKSTINSGYDHPPFWSPEFYAAWKDWILPNYAVSTDDVGVRRFSSISSSKGGICFGVNRSVSLAPIVCCSSRDHSKFRFSYVAWVIKCLEGLSEGARGELALILEASVRQGRFGELGNGFVGVSEGGLELDKGGIFSFLMIGKGICEAVLAFHLEGLVAGCLGLSCFSFDELGGICVDLNEALMMGRKFVNAVSTKHEEEATCKDCLENEVFASPEVLYELLLKRGTSLDSGHSRYPIGYGSDVWSLACVLLRLLIGSALPRNTLKMKEENDGDISASYVCWVEKVSSVMEDKLGSEYLSLRKILCKCLDVNPGNLNLVDVRKCIQDMLVKLQFDFLGNLISRDSTCHCLVLGELCLLPKQSSNGPIEHELQEKESDSQPNFLQNGKDKSDEFAAGSPKGMTEHKDLRGKSKKS
ncbi:hypothetical protein JHK85_011564 [Glycine max]|nr:hypothetical protein JHK85_011564 [Glycine max]KAG5067516.1 hypothetical protein JHK86_011247 [Glycine max]